MGVDAAGFFSQLGLALVILRAKASLSARELAAKAGVGKSQLSNARQGCGDFNDGGFLNAGSDRSVPIKAAAGPPHEAD